MNVSVAAWEAADAAKHPGESFTDLLLRTFRPTGVLDMAGVLGDEEARRWQDDMADSRSRSRARSDRMDDAART